MRGRHFDSGIVATLAAATFCACASTQSIHVDGHDAHATDTDDVLYEVISRGLHLEAPCPGPKGPEACLFVAVAPPDASKGEREARLPPLSSSLRARLKRLPVRLQFGCKSNLGAVLTVGPIEWQGPDRALVRAEMMLSGLQGTFTQYELSRAEGGGWKVQSKGLGFYN
jgi:hypothetical protein